MNSARVCVWDYPIKMKSFFLLLACAVMVAVPVHGEDASAKRLKPTPWHLIDTWWNLGQDHEFESYSIDVTISDEVPASVNLYIAPIGLGHLNKTPFYGGIQTQADGYQKKDRRLRKIGPGYLMSMWGQRGHDAIRPSQGGYCQSSGHEGDFVSVRRPHAWTKGRYTYRITRMDREVVDGKLQTWVGAFVYSHEKDENIFIGALRFPGEKLVLSQRVANFVEIYGRVIPVGKIPQVTVTFSNPTVNGNPVKDATAFAVYPDGVPDYANAIAKKGALVIRVGEKVMNRTKRRVRLLPPE